MFPSFVLQPVSLLQFMSEAIVVAAKGKNVWTRLET